MNPGLTVRGLQVDRVGQPVVRSVDLDVPAGEVTVLLGANGVGKSTLLDGIAGVAPVAAGSVVVAGVDLTGARRTRRVSNGLVYVQQGRAIFADLTVEENLQVVASNDRFGEALELFPELGERMSSRAELLSGGEQQMLVLARAMLQDPKVLMIDELSLGLAPIIVDRMLEAVTAIAADGTGVLLVEQFAHKALAVGDTGLVMSRGEIVISTDAAALGAQPELLQRAYLGQDLGQDFGQDLGQDGQSGPPNDHLPEATPTAIPSQGA